MTKQEADRQLSYVRALRIRLLGDRVLQNVAWRIADTLGWPDTFDAENIALTRLQADASSGDEVGGVVELGGDLELSAEGFDISAQDRDGNSVEVAAFDVGDTGRGYAHGIGDLPLGQRTVAADVGEAVGADFVVEAALRGGAFGIGADVVTGGAAGFVGAALGFVPGDGHW
jgi:hypothetical protein